MDQFIAGEYEVKPVFVSNDFDFGLNINYEPLSAVGADRLVNSFAAAEKYGVPCVVCSFGTATTIDVIDAKRELLGGLIAPGIQTMSAALRQMTSKLPEVEMQKPATTLGTTTIESIRSGIYFSQLGLVESVVARITDEIGTKPVVVATGGFASEIAADTKIIEIVDDLLTLDGLRMLYLRKSS